MTLNEFIEQFDKEGSIILLEGKRKVLAEDAEKLTALGKILATSTTKMIFRSGNAEGADDYFSHGVSEINYLRLQVITPYNGHRERYNKAYKTISMEDIDLAAEPEVVSQSKNNKKTKKLIDHYASGNIDRFTIKAAYIIRDTVKAIGTQRIQPATFGIFYDDLENEETGGTGHTMNVCKQNNIPFINQKTWFTWLT